jgi:hypothetical protein
VFAVGGVRGGNIACGTGNGEGSIATSFVHWTLNEQEEDKDG